MVKKPTRLQFTEDDLAVPEVKQAFDRAEKKADKAEKAVEKLASKKNHEKLRTETTVSSNRKEKLRFGKSKPEAEIAKPSSRKQVLTRSAAAAISVKAHQAVSSSEDDNSGVQAADTGVQAGESVGYAADHLRYSHKLKAYDKAEKLVNSSDKANVDALYEKFKKDNPDAGSNPLSRWRQKHAIKKEYAAARAGRGAGKTRSAASAGAKKTAEGTKNIVEKVTEFCVSHKKPMLIILIVGLLFMVITAAFSSCTAMLQGGTQIILQTSFTAETDDIVGANDDYKALEKGLQRTIDNIERTHPGYDEYRYSLSEINHNPYELTAYLTVHFEGYTREEVQATLQNLFDQQYELRLEEEVEIRTRTETRTGTRIVHNPDGTTSKESYEYEVEVEYEYYILNVILINHGLNSVIINSGMTDDEMERYRILLETKGNRPELFEGDIYANIDGEYTDYDIPGEALTDERFARMIREAEKYLGYPYVWGGSSPSTSFDCSGFVSWVINNCGNGWSVGRCTVSTLLPLCDVIPRSAAKPGDLVFFHSTYDAPGNGPTHVAIYVGNDMMIHCGNPISYTSMESNYWQQHFYCFGRIRD